MEAAAMVDFDLLVIGGGPGGSCAAALARRAGMSVALVEKEVFPRFRIGESLLPMGNAVLRASGVWPRIEAAGFIEKFGARFLLADGLIGKRIDFSRGYVRGLDRTFQVERARFDQLLLDHARDLGAVVRMPCAATQLRFEDDRVAVTLRDPALATDEVITARWVIDAGGRENRCAHGIKRTLDRLQIPRRIAVYSHFEEVPRPAGAEAGDTVVIRLEDGWFWLIPIDEKRTSIGLVTTIEAMRAAGGEPAQVFQNVVDEVPHLRTLLERAQPTMPFRVTADYSYFRRELAHPRLLHVGDAAGFFDPIFSSGVYLATYAARLAVAALERARAGQRALTRRECAAYTRTIKRHSSVFARLIEAFYDNDSFAVFLSSEPPFDLERGLTSIVAGHAQLTFPLWWRFKFFLLVCRIQRRVKLVTPLATAHHVAADRRVPA